MFGELFLWVFDDDFVDCVEVVVVYLFVCFFDYGVVGVVMSEFEEMVVIFDGGCQMFGFGKCVCYWFVVYDVEVGVESCVGNWCVQMVWCYDGDEVYCFVFGEFGFGVYYFFVVVVVVVCGEEEFSIGDL